MSTDRFFVGRAAQYPSAAGEPCILVTGGAGYVGSHVVLELLDSGFRTVVLDNLVTDLRPAVDPRAAFVEGCLEDEALVRRLYGTTTSAASFTAPARRSRRSPSATPSNIIATTPQRADRFLKAPSWSTCVTSYFPPRPRYTARRDCRRSPRNCSFRQALAMCSIAAMAADTQCSRSWI